MCPILLRTALASFSLADRVYTRTPLFGPVAPATFMLDQSVHPRFLLIFESMKNSLVILNSSFAVIKRDTNKMAEMIDSGMDITANAITLYIYVVSFIDFSFRYRQLLDSLPHLNKKEQEIKKFFSEFSSLKDIRNYLQHIRGDLVGNDVVDYPILGSVTWIYNGSLYSTTLNQKCNKFSTYGIPFDLKEGCYVHEIEYGVKNMVVSIDMLHKRCNEIYDTVKMKYNFSDPLFSAKIIDHAYSVKVEIGLTGR